MLDEAVIRNLNGGYITAFMTSNTEWYERHLTRDFTCAVPDGPVLDRAAFIARAAAGPDIVEYQLERVRVRVDGDTATVDGSGSYLAADGTRGVSRYTDAYRRVGGEWKVCRAMFARFPADPGRRATG